jgi:hypothetical protein
LWPEGWSCYRGLWEEAGCTVGKHVGIVLEDHIQLCINHGNIGRYNNGKSKFYPDSFCGVPFNSKTAGNCTIHEGYLMKNKDWSCCNGKMLSDL